MFHKPPIHPTLWTNFLAYIITPSTSQLRKTPKTPADSPQRQVNPVPKES
jgi:hypothetical protein